MRPITWLQWAIQCKAAYSSNNVCMLQCTELLFSVLHWEFKDSATLQ